MEREISGYYFDGQKFWIIYQDENGNETMEEDKMGRYRKVIDFDVVKESEKAVLILVKDCKSTAFRKLVKKAKKHSVLNPLEVWVPKKWIKYDREYTYVGMPVIWNLGTINI